MDIAEQKLIEFAEGKIEIEKFIDMLVSVDAFEKYLKDDCDLQRGSYIGGSTYDYVIGENITRLEGQLNIHGAICEHLDRKKVKYSPTPKYEEIHSLLVSSQPVWLDIDSSFFKEVILGNNQCLNKSELKKRIKENIKRQFKYVSNPPKWIQNPMWPINENIPMLFLGQLDVKNYLHDDSVVYVFYDEMNGETKVIIQKS